MSTPWAPNTRVDWQFRDGLITARLIYVIAKLGIPDLLAHGPRASADLAQATDTDADTLHRVLRYLCHRGVCVKTDDDRFGLTKEAEVLRTDVPGSLRYWSIMWGESWYEAFGDILYTVRTGKPAFDKQHGMPFFDFVKQDPTAAQLWDRSMSQNTLRAATEIARAYDFSVFPKIADIAGGVGSLLTAILQVHPTVQGVLFEMPTVLASARAFLDQHGVLARCELVAGSFFESVVPGCDAYIMKAILHDWNDEDCIRILRSIRAAIPAHGKLLNVKRLIRDETDAATIDATIADMLLLTGFGGRERTEAELHALFLRGGFSIIAKHPVGAFHILEAIPV